MRRPGGQSPGRRALRGCAALLGLAFLAGSAPEPASAGDGPCSVKTLLYRAENLEDDRAVAFTWLGEVTNRGSEPVSAPVRIVVRDQAWKPLAYLDLPAVEVAPGGAVRQEAVFEMEKALWRRACGVDCAVAVAGEGEEP